MPKNNNLQKVQLPMEIKFGDEPKTRFRNNLEAINVELMSAPSMEDLMRYLPQFAEATWAPYYNSNDNMSLPQKLEVIMNVFHGKTLPTALETINLVFRISGISLQEVTHIIRYRNASFSADCSGDKWWTDKDALVPTSIQNSNGYGGDDATNFNERYMAIVEAAKELYCDMINSKKISIMDARYILPRCLSTFYYMRISLKDALHFIKQRIDKQIQPETDNLIAYQMYYEILKKYPVANGLVNIHAPSMFYVNTARTGKATNLYFPDSDSDIFEYNEDDFIYQCRRDEMNGTDIDAQNKFNEYLKRYDNLIEEQEKENDKKLKELIDLYHEYTQKVHKKLLKRTGGNNMSRYISAGYKDLIEKILDNGYCLKDSFETMNEFLRLENVNFETIDATFGIDSKDFIDKFETKLDLDDPTNIYVERGLYGLNIKTVYDMEHYVFLNHAIRDALIKFRDDCLSTRRAVINFPDGHCFTSVQLMLRKGVLHATATMRSCNVLNNLPYDLCIVYYIQSMAYKYLKSEFNARISNECTIYFNIGSLHIMADQAHLIYNKVRDCRPFHGGNDTIREEE